PQNLDRELVSLYRSWDKLERARHSNSVIDFDLAAPGRSSPARNRQEIIRRLDEMLLDLSASGSGLSKPTVELITARRKASRLYLSALCGEIVPFEEYIAGTL